MKTKYLSIAMAWGLLGLALGLVWLLTLPVSAASAQSTTRYVSPTGVDVGTCTNRFSPCRTVQYAVDQAAAGDVVKVAAGTYTGINNYGGLAQVVYIDKSITIRGGYTAPGFTDPPDPEANPTTLDAQRDGRVIYITGEIDVTIEGLRITGGDADELGGDFTDSDAGAGVYIIDATVAFNNNQVFDNSDCYRGGGLYLANSNAVLTGNVISSNTTRSWGTGWGGGMFLYESQVTFDKNTFLTNHAYAGGGIHVYKSEASFNQNAFEANSAEHYGGGLLLHESTCFASDGC